MTICTCRKKRSYMIYSGQVRGNFKYNITFRRLCIRATGYGPNEECTVFNIKIVMEKSATKGLPQWYSVYVCVSVNIKGERETYR